MKNTRKNNDSALKYIFSRRDLHKMDFVVFRPLYNIYNYNHIFMKMPTQYFFII